MICFLALVLHRVIRMRVEAGGHDASPQTALDLLSRIQEHTANIGIRTFTPAGRYGSNRPLQIAEPAETRPNCDVVAKWQFPLNNINDLRS